MKGGTSRTSTNSRTRAPGFQEDETRRHQGEATVCGGRRDPRTFYESIASKVVDTVKTSARQRGPWQKKERERESITRN